MGQAAEPNGYTMRHGPRDNAGSERDDACGHMDHVVRALIEHYDATDAETKRIVPLKRLYWPA